MAKEVERQVCPRLSFNDLNLTKPAVEPKTGIEFPMVLDNAMAGEQNSSFNSEVNIWFTIWFFVLILLTLLHFVNSSCAPCICLSFG